MAVDPLGSVNGVQFQSLQGALAGGDMEAVMLMLGEQNAKTQEGLVKTQITQIQTNNAKLRQLDAVMQKLLGKDDKKGTAINLTADDLKLLKDNGINVGDYLETDKQTIAEFQAMFNKMPNTDGAVVTTDPAMIQKFAEFCRDHPDFTNNAHGGFNFIDANGKNVWEGAAVGGDWKKLTVEHYGGMDLNSVKNGLNTAYNKAGDQPKLTGDGKLDKLRQSLQKSMDSLSSDDQLNMISLQSAVSKQNNAIELMSTIMKKFADLKSSIARNF